MISTPKPEPSEPSRRMPEAIADPRRAALRRELLRRIVDRESRRQGSRFAAG